MLLENGNDLTVDIPSLTVTRRDRHKEISRRESEIILFFAAHPNRVISREELYEKVWGESMNEIETRTVDMHIAKLRSKIEPDPNEPTLIKTIRGGKKATDKAA